MLILSSLAAVAMYKIQLSCLNSSGLHIGQCQIASVFWMDFMSCTIYFLISGMESFAMRLLMRVDFCLISRSVRLRPPWLIRMLLEHFDEIL